MKAYDLTSFTKREIQVLECAAFHGLDAKETANWLGVSYETVRSQWKSILSKSRARNKGHLLYLIANAKTLG